MNKKNIISIIFIITILSGGIIFWQFSKQNASNRQVAKNNNSITADLSKVNNPQKVEKNLVEVFYLPHPPVDPIRKKIKSILEKFPEYKLKEYDFDNNSNKQKIENYNLLEHIPIAIFINETDTFLIDGQEITFKNFPKGDTFVPSLEGSWSYDDLEKVLANPNKYQK